MKKGMTLAETLVALCVSTLLLLGLGTSLFMFKNSNLSTINQATNEQSILSIEDYIRNNSDLIVEKNLKKTYFYAKSEKLSNHYWLYSVDKKFYLVDSSNYDGELIEDLGEIRVASKGSRYPKKTINGEYVVGFNVPDYDQDSPYFIVTTDDETGETEKVLLEKKDIADRIYYSEAYKDADFFKNMFAYKDGELSIKLKKDSEGNTVTETVFNKLPFDASEDSLKINFAIEAETFVIRNKDKSDLIDLYGSEYVNSLSSEELELLLTQEGIVRDENGNPEHDNNGNEIIGRIPVSGAFPTYGVEVESDNVDYGVAYVDKIDFNNKVATLIAKECYTENVYISDKMKGYKITEIEKFLEENDFSYVRFVYVDGTNYEKDRVVWIEPTGYVDPEDRVVVYVSNGPKGTATEDNKDDFNIEDIEPGEAGEKADLLSHKFLGWYTEDGEKYSDNHEIQIELPTAYSESAFDDIENVKNKYIHLIARFDEDKKALADDYNENYVIKTKTRYSIAQKVVYTVKCRMIYKIDGVEYSREFVVDTYEKYIPDIYVQTNEKND